jgi:predicted metal-dependent peptidase
MLIHKVALIAGALVVSAATMAQAHDQGDLGARSVVIDNYDNARALQDQASNRAYQAQFRQPRQEAAFNYAPMTHVTR